MKKNIFSIRFVQSFIFLPLLTNMVSVTGVAGLTIPGFTTVSGQSQIASIESEEQKIEKILTIQAKHIDEYYSSRNLPLAGHGYTMARVAMENNIDWRLIPAIGMRESTGGKFACTSVDNSPFGWGSCKINFKTMELSIETVGRNLGGNNPKTARFYANKSVQDILKAYNPPHIVEKYSHQVMDIMEEIGPKDVVIQ